MQNNSSSSSYSMEHDMQSLHDGHLMGLLVDDESPEPLLSQPSHVSEDIFFKEDGIGDVVARGGFGDEGGVFWQFDGPHQLDLPADRTPSGRTVSSYTFDQQPMFVDDLYFSTAATTTSTLLPVVHSAQQQQSSLLVQPQPQPQPQLQLQQQPPQPQPQPQQQSTDADYVEAGASTPKTAFVWDAMHQQEQSCIAHALPISNNNTHNNNNKSELLPPLIIISSSSPASTTSDSSPCTVTKIPYTAFPTKPSERKKRAASVVTKLGKRSTAEHDDDDDDDDDYDDYLGEEGSSNLPAGSESWTKAGKPVQKKGKYQFRTSHPTETADGKPKRSFSTAHMTSHNVTWSVHEHELFIQGLKICGIGKWKAIAEVVGSRNGNQVKYHARQHFKRLATGKQ